MKTLIKLIVVIFTITLLKSHVQAQSPEAFNYQAMALNSSNMALKNQQIGLQISLLEGGQNGNAVYVERHYPTTSDKGLFSLQIGTGNIQSGDFSNADWGSDTYWIKVEADFNGGNNYSLLGVNQMVSVPYAMHAQTVDNADDADADPSNEIQILSKNGNMINLSNGGGQIMDAIEDADADPSNEIQSIFKNGNMIELSNGGGQIMDAVEDADADPSNEIQQLSKNANIVQLSNGGGQFIDAVDDADSNPTNEIQNLSINNNVLSLSQSNATIDLSPYNNHWVKVPNTEIIDYKSPDALARVMNDDNTLNLSPDLINYIDTSECRTYFENGSLIYDREITLAPDLKLINPVAGFSKDSIYFDDFEQNPDDISHSMMSKNITYFYDEISGHKFEGSLEPYQMDFRINDTEAWGNYDAFGLQARAEAVPGLSAAWELDLKAGFGLFMAEDDGNNGRFASLSNPYGIQIGKGIGFGIMEEVRTELNQDSLVFDYFVDNGLQSGFAHYGRDEMSMKYQAGALSNSSCMSPYNICVESDLAGQKISMNLNHDNLEFENPNGGYSFTHVGLDSIHMNKYVGLLFPDEMTLKPHQLMFENIFSQSFLNNRGLEVKTILSPSDIFTQIDLQPDAFTMYNGAKWKNVNLGTRLGANAGQLDLWSGTGDFKLVELGADNLDGLAGSLQLFSHNSGAHSPAWLRVRQNHGELTLHGPNTLNVLVSARNNEGGLVQVYNTVEDGTACASMFADSNDKGVVEADHIYVGQHPGDQASFPLKVVQTPQLGINLERADQTQDWELYVKSNDALGLYSNGTFVGEFNAISGAYSQISDRRLKVDIQELDTQLSKIERLNPSRYAYIKNNPDKKESLGLIAQDLQKVYPELVNVSTDKRNEGILTVDYSGLTVVAIKAIQEQQELIEVQNNKIEDLEEEMRTLKTLVQKLINDK